MKLSVHEMKNGLYFILSTQVSPRADDNLIAEAMCITYDEFRQVLIEKYQAFTEKGYGLVFGTSEAAQKCVDEYIKLGVINNGH